MVLLIVLQQQINTSYQLMKINNHALLRQGHFHF